MPVEGVSWVGAAGYDYRELVNKLIAAQRQPIQLMQNRQATIDKVKSAWTDIKTRLQNLDAALDALKLDGTYGGRKATSSDQAVFTATADTTASTGTYAISVTSLARAHAISSDDKGSGYTLSATDQNGDAKLSFTLRGTEIEVADGDTLANIRDKINAAGAGVTASVIDNKLVLKAGQTGTANAITVDADPDGILGTLGVVNSGTTTIRNELQTALNAEFTVDGLSLTRSSNTVSDAISGVTLQLVGAGSGKTLTVAQDTQAAVDKIKAFVDQYNSVLDLIRQKTARDGKTGKREVLFGDTTATRLERMLRGRISTVVSGLTTYDRLSQIGIKTAGSGVDAANKGLLSVDETELTDALEADAGAVKELFFASSGSINGIGELLEADVTLYTTATTGLIDAKGKSLTQQYDTLKKQIDRLEDTLARRKESMINRFVAAERVLTMLQQQGSFLTSQMNMMFR